MAIRLLFSKIENGAEGTASGSIDASLVSGIHHVVSVGAIDSLSFNIHYPASGHCEWIRPFCTLVEAYDGNELIFRGRVIDIDVSQADNGTKAITCEGEQGFLKDSFIFPGSRNPDAEDPEPDPEDPERDPQGQILYTNGRGYRGWTTGQTVVPPLIKSAWNEGYFDIANIKAGTRVELILQNLVRVHNAYVTGSLRLSGYSFVNTSAVIKNDIELAGKTVYEAMDAIAEDQNMEWRAGCIYGSGSFMLEMRRTFGESKGKLSTGMNLKSVSKTVSVSDIYTAILPLGGYGYDEKRLSLTTYTCNSSAITGLHDGNLISYTDIVVGSRGRPYIKNTQLVKMYGLRIKLVIYDDISVNGPEEYGKMRNELLKRAQKDVAELAKGVVSFSADAIDFENSPIGGPGPELEPYNYYEVEDYITGINVKLRLTQKDTNYDDILNPSLTFELDDRTNVAEPIGIGVPQETLIIYNNYTGNNKG